MAEPCGLRRRIAAILYDTLLMSSLWFLASIPFVTILGEYKNWQSSSMGTVHQLTLFLVAYVFLVGFWTAKGRTLGMQSWGLQLETEDGSVPGKGAATVRFLAACLSWAVFGLGFLWQLWDRDRLTWHDRLSKTRLIYHPRQSQSQT